MKDTSTSSSDTSGKLFLPSLVLSASAVQPIFIIAGMLLLDIGTTFNQPVGVMGQIQTVASIAGAISAILMGMLSIRYSHKSLLLAGLILYALSAAGCFMATDFILLFAVYALAGVAIPMVLPMVYALVGDHLPLEKRAGAIGLMMAGVGLSSLIAAPVIGFIAGTMNWRWTFLGYALPVVLLALFLSIKGVPASTRGQEHGKDQEKYWIGFKAILSNRSATACLIGGGFSTVAWMALVLYGTSFLRESFSVPLEFVPVFILLASSCFIIGNLIVVLLVNRFGRRLTITVSAILAGIFTISYVNVPILELSLACGSLTSLFSGILSSASVSLTLEQVPRFRGSMMAVSSAATRIGEAIGAAIGGIVLVIYDYGMVGISLGMMSFVAALIFYFLVIDPSLAETEQVTSPEPSLVH